MRALPDARRWCPSIVYAGSGRAWAQTDDKKLQLINRRRAVKDTIDTDFAFNDITISPQGNLLLSDKDSNSIVSISGEKVAKTLFNTSTNMGWFKTSCKSHGLCYLHSGDIAVTFADEGRVVIYSMSGKVIKELDKKLFRYPRKVAQSKINSDLYIADNDAKHFFVPGRLLHWIGITKFALNTLGWKAEKVSLRLTYVQMRPAIFSLLTTTTTLYTSWTKMVTSSDI